MMRRGFQVVSKILKLEPMKIPKGTDFNGNKYFEVPPQKYYMGLREVMKLKRTVETPNMEVDSRDGLDPGKNVPTEWMAWLQLRRKDPPTLEELENNLIRMHKIKEKARLMDQKHHELKEKSIPEPKPFKKELEQTDVESWTPK